jgi:hypothetical protein
MAGTKGRDPSANKMKTMSRVGSALKYKNIGKEKPGITSNMKEPTPPLSRGESRNKKLRTAAQNLVETGHKYPGMEGMINLHYKDEYKDVFEKVPH